MDLAHTTPERELATDRGTGAASTSILGLRPNSQSHVNMISTIGGLPGPLLQKAADASTLEVTVLVILNFNSGFHIHGPLAGFSLPQVSANMKLDQRELMIPSCLFRESEPHAENYPDASKECLHDLNLASQREVSRTGRQLLNHAIACHLFFWDPLFAFVRLQ